MPKGRGRVAGRGGVGRVDDKADGGGWGNMTKVHDGRSMVHGIKGQMGDAQVQAAGPAEGARHGVES